MKNRLLLRHITLLIGVMFFVSNSLFSQAIFDPLNGDEIMQEYSSDPAVCSYTVDVTPPADGTIVLNGEQLIGVGSEFPILVNTSGFPATINAVTLASATLVTPGILTSSGSMYNILSDVSAGSPTAILVVTYNMSVTVNGTTSIETISFNINVSDTTPPTYMDDMGNPVTSDLPDEIVDCNLGVTPTTLDVIDFCGNINSIGTSPTYATPLSDIDLCEGGSTVRSWSTSDPSGNTTTISQTVIVSPDTDAPTMVGFPADMTFDCAGDVPPAETSLTATDCTAISTASSDDMIAGTCANNFVIERTYTVSDACGNSAVQTQMITVEDNVAPTFASAIDAPANGLFLCNAGMTSGADLFTAWVNNGAGANVTDNCPGSIVMTATFGGVDITSDPASILNTPCASGSYEVEFTFTDICNGSVSGSAVYDIVDGNAPEITIGATDETIECSDDLATTGAINTFLFGVGTSQASDLCSAIVDTAFIINGTMYDYQTGFVAARDAILAEIDAQEATCTVNEVARVTVMFQYTDACNNSSTTDADFIVVDNESPVWVDMPDDLTLECGNDNNTNIGEWVLANMEQTPFMDVSGAATDCSDVTYTNDYTGISDLCGDTGAALVTFTAEDACGNTTTAQATITIEDTTPPTLDDPAMDMTVECDGAGNTVAFSTWLNNNASATATDVCGGVAWSNQSTDIANPCGTNTATTVAFTATDDCGNTTITTGIFTIDDTTIPAITQQAAPDLVQCDGLGNTTELNAWLDSQGGAIATDVCGGVTWTHNYGGTNILIDDCGATGAVTVVFTATDDCGNSDTSEATFTIFDNENPMITTAASDDTAQCDGSGNTLALTTWLSMNGGAEATDNCSTVIWTNDFVAITDPCGTGATVTFTATDDCDNSAQTTATFTIEDTTAPDVSNCPSLDRTEECAGTYTSGTTGMAWNDVNIARLENCATDNCGNITVTSDYPGTFTSAAGCINTGTVMVVYTVTDDCSQSATVMGTLTIEDTVSPTIAPTATGMSIDCDNTAGTNDTALQSWLNTQGGAIAQDNCSLANWVQYDWVATDATTIPATVTMGSYTYGIPMGTQLIAPDGNCQWSAVVTFVSADQCNNTSSVDATFTIEDSIDPVFTSVPADAMVECDAIPMVGTPTATDNCDMNIDIVPTEVTTTGSCTDNYIITRTWTASDDCGNTALATQVITVEDTTDPVVMGTPASTTVECDAVPAMPVIGTDIMGMDNCDTDVTITFMETRADGSCPNNYTLTRTWTAEDNCGNTGSSSQVIIIQDTTSPTGSGELDTLRAQCMSANLFPPVTTIAALENMGVMIEDNCSTDQSLLVFSIDDTLTMTCPLEINRTYTFVDECSNPGSVFFVQNIIINDTIAPILTAASDLAYDCTTATFNSADAAFQDWIMNNGGATVSDNCTATADLMWFVYNSNTNSEAATLMSMACPSDRMQSVDFIAEDMCGNRDTTTAVFTVIDEEAPVFETCGDDVTLSTNEDGLNDYNCTVEYDLPIPIVLDGCSDITTCSSTATSTIVSSTPGSTLVLVNDVSLSFTVNAAPTAALGSVTLDLSFLSIDGEFDAANGIQSEFFLAFGENDMSGNPYAFGPVGITATQCGDVTNTLTIPANIFNLWAADGTVDITLEVNDPGAGSAEAGINDICGNSSVTGTLSYNCQTPPSGFSVGYVLSGATSFPATGSGFVFNSVPLNAGRTTVTYYAEDCAGNVSSCEYDILVVDDENPMMDCTALNSIVSPIPAPLCSPQEVTLPRPFGITDNCAIDTYFETMRSGVDYPSITFTEHPNIDGYVMDTVNVSFTGITPMYATGDAVLDIYFVGDGNNNTAQELLEIIGEDGMSYGVTNPTTVDCGSVTMPENVATITIPYATLLTWIADGSIDITVAPVVSTLAGASNDGDWNNDDLGINPCSDPANPFPNSSATPINDSNRTLLSLELSFPNPILSYCVEGATIITTTAFPTTGDDAMVTLNPGVNTITYKVTDLAGNTAICNRVVTVGDTTIVAPILDLVDAPTCPNDVVEIVDIQDYEMNLDTLNNPVWSWYCDIDGDGVQSVGDSLVGTTTVPSIFLQVATGDNDYYALVNDGLCFSAISDLITISVNNFITKPEIIAAPTTICVGDEFGLFIQNSAVEWDTYTWTGSNGYSFDGPFPPVITNATTVATSNSVLTYILEVTSVNNCTARDTVLVEVRPAPETPNLASNSPVCNGQPIMLNTSATCDTYQWIGPNGTSTSTLASYGSTTTTPMTTVLVGTDGYAEGMWSVICINNNGCSVESAPVEVIINDPLVIAGSSNSPVCEGEDIQLISNTIPGATYTWGILAGTFTTVSNQSNPIIENATLADAGTYFLVVTDADGCSAQETVNVVVNTQPVVNSISISPSITCVDGNTDITLTPTVDGVSAPTGYTYSWTSDNGFTSTSSEAILPNATSADNGSYVLVVTNSNDCTSDAFTMVVDLIDTPTNPTLSVNATQLCEGDDLVLTTNGYSGSTVTYEWFDSSGSLGMTSNVASFTINNVTAADSDNYYVIVTVDGCVSNASGEVVVAVNINPATPTLPAMIAVCEGDQISLQPDQTQIAGATYTWTGSNGFTSNLYNPTIFPASMSNEASYRVQVDLNGCVSDVSDAVLVTVSDAPDAPTLSNNGPVCIDETGATLTLSVDSGTATAGASYEWFYLPTGATIGTSLGTSALSTNFDITDFTTYTTGSLEFYVQATIGTCTTAPSVPTTVVLGTAPTKPEISASPLSVCSGEDFGLFLLNNSNDWVSYSWTGSNGYSATTQAPPAVTGASNTSTMNDTLMYVLTVENALGCMASDTVMVEVLPVPETPVLEINGAVCFGDNILLASNDNCDTYQWIGPNGTSTTVLGSYSSITTVGITSVPSTSAAYAGGMWTLVCYDAAGCSATSEPVEVILGDQVTASLEASYSVCEGGTLQLFPEVSANAVTFEWSGAITFPPNVQNPIITNANASSGGLYTFKAYDQYGCVSNIVFTIVNVNSAPVIESIVVDPIANVCVTGDDDITLTPSIDSGSDLSGYTYSWVGVGGLTSTNGVLVLPNGTSADNGSYTLVATSIDGCVSDPMTIVVDVRDTPATPALNIVSSDLCEGDDLTMTTQGYTGNDVGYAWFNNGNLVGTTTVPSLTLNDVDVSGSGNYTVLVGVDGCTSNASQSIPVIIGAMPNTPIISGPVSVCAGDVLQISTGFITGATYTWTGPNNFTSSVYNPTIFPANAADEGSYSVQIEVNGCSSNISAPLNVSVFDSPATPTISNNGPICVSDPAAVLTLSVDVSTATPGASYEWFNASTNMSIGSSGLSTNFNVPNLGTYGTGMAEFYVVASLGSCNATASIPTAASLNGAPIAPQISALPNSLCAGEDFGLFIDNDSDDWVNFTWTGTNGYTFNGEMPPAITGATTTATMNDTLMYVLTVESAAGCTSTDTVFVEILAVPETPTLITNTPLCDNEALTLSTSNVCDSYQWIGPNGDAASILGSYNSTTTAGTTTIPASSAAYSAGLWTVICITNDGCSATSEPVEVMVSNPIVLEINNSGPACEGDDVQLTASDVDNGTYQWVGPGFSSTNQNPIINNVTAAETGTYILIVRDANGCSALGTTQLVVQSKPVITAVSINMQACVTGLEDITLNPTVDDGDGQVGDTGAPYSYSWTSANAFVSTSEVAVLPNGTSADNGSYVLVVTSANGCQSDPFTVVVDVRDQPATPNLVVNSEGLCAGDDLTLTTDGYAGSVVTYQWFNGATLLTTTTTPSHTVTNVSGADSGSYSVIVTVDGCTSNASQVIPVNVGAIPNTPTVTGPMTVCEGNPIQLETTLIDGATYAWTGPDGFSASVHNPSIPSSTIESGGDYMVQITMNGCTSAMSTAFTVTVGATPSLPTVINNGPVCIDNAAAVLTLSVTTGTATTGATYEWFDATSNNSIGSSGPSPDFNITDFTSYPEGTYEFYVVASVGGCDSEASASSIVVLNGIPDLIADAGDDLNVCDGMSISLNGEVPTEGIGTWTQVGATDINIANPNIATTSITGLVAGNTYTFQWTLSNGSCGDYSSDQVDVVVSAANQTAEAGSAGFACNASSFNLNAEAAIAGNTGTWSQSAIQSQLGVVIVVGTNPATQVTGLVAGNTYEFTWTLSNDACGDFDTDVVQVTVEDNMLNASAGDDFVACGGGDATILAQPLASCTGTWSSPDPELVFADELAEGTVVMDLKPGVNTLVWTVNCGPCGIDTDTLFITYETLAATIADVATVSFNESIEVDVLANDNLPTDYTVTIIDEPTNGSVSLVDTGVYGYTHEGTDATPDQFTYQVCSTSCPDVCSNVTTVSIIVAVSEDCTIPTIITPNGDGINDALVVECLFASGKYPNNQVAIYNQWGDEVFRAMPYENNWEGTYNGEELPVGTYFYYVDLGDGSETLTGFLVIER